MILALHCIADTSTALQIAAMEGHPDCVQLLTDANSSLDLVSLLAVSVEGLAIGWFSGGR